MKKYKRGKHNPTIGMSNEEVTNYWITESIKKFNNKYKYDKVGIIKTKKDKVLIGCPIHGYNKMSFTQHINTEGCAKCGDQKCRDSKRMTFEEFLERVNKIHPEKSFRIISREFKGRQIKHEKVYTQDEYGICKIGVGTLLIGGKPSVKSACFKNQYAERMYRKSVGYEGLHFNNSEYKTSLSYIEVRCFKHGIFKTKPNWIISSRRRCPKCSDEKRHLRGRSNTREFINKAIGRLNTNRRIYDKVEYVHAKEKVIILCEHHNKYYKITPNDHLNGYGCPECGIENGGFSRKDYIKLAKGKKATLYIIKCFNDNEEFYKVGITLVGVKKRFQNTNRLPYSYKIIHQYEGTAGDIWDVEKDILRRFNSEKYVPSIRFPGFTECFSKGMVVVDVLNYITQEYFVFKPPVPLECDYAIGDRYSEVH